MANAAQCRRLWTTGSGGVTLEEQMAADMAEYQAQLELEYNQEQEDSLRMHGVAEQRI